jgi:N-acetyltransferase
MMKHRVRLEMLHERHAPALHQAGNDPDIWRYLPGQAFRTLADSRAWVLNALDDYHRGKRIPYAIVEAESSYAIGSTSFINLRKAHRSVMIGMTWLSPENQGTGINTECKYLLLTHAFDAMNAVRVELLIDERNVKSQRAVERLGAVKEGLLRAHMIEQDGFIRNSVYYSFIDSEWPETKERILALIDRRKDSPVPMSTCEVSMCS